MKVRINCTHDDFDAIAYELMQSNFDFSTYDNEIQLRDKITMVHYEGQNKLLLISGKKEAYIGLNRFSTFSVKD